MIATFGTFDRISLESAAALAGVTQQAAYRYFANVDDLVRAAVHRMQAIWNARFLDFIAAQGMAEPGELVDATVAFIVETYDSQIRASARLKRDILRHYHDIDYDAAVTVAEAIVDMGAGRDRLGTSVGAGQLAAGLVGLWAVAKSLTLGEAGQLERPDTRRIMTRMFLAALQPDERMRPTGLARLA
jgi:AcrR family transcriptional regulator